MYDHTISQFANPFLNMTWYEDKVIYSYYNLNHFSEGFVGSKLINMTTLDGENWHYQAIDASASLSN